MVTRWLKKIVKKTRKVKRCGKLFKFLENELRVQKLLVKAPVKGNCADKKTTYYKF